MQMLLSCDLEAHCGFRAACATSDGRHQCPRPWGGHCQGPAMAGTCQHCDNPDLRSTDNSTRVQSDLQGQLLKYIFLRSAGSSRRRGNAPSPGLVRSMRLNTTPSSVIDAIPQEILEATTMLTRGRLRSVAPTVWTDQLAFQSGGQIPLNATVRSLEVAHNHLLRPGALWMF